MYLHLYRLACSVKEDVIASMSNCSDPPDKQPSDAVTRAWIGLMRAQRLVLAAIERELKHADLPPLAWYDVLLELARAQGGRLRPFEIEERTLLAQYNLSRLLDRLQREDLIRRESFDADGRGCWVVITEAGRDLQARIWAVYARAIATHVGARLDDERASTLAELLARLGR